jgi:hypothetical protein
MNDSGPSWPSAIVAVAFLALVGVFFWKSVDSGNFSEIWAAVGTIVGVVTGAIPSYFFKKDADAAHEQAETANRREVALASAAPQDVLERARAANPNLFG